MKNLASRALVAATALMAVSVAGAQQIRVEVDNRNVHFTDVTPRMINGRVMVPLRGVFEELGANVEWNSATRTVTAVRGDTDVQLRIGERTARINGRNETLDVPAQLIGGRTMVPLRFVSEALGADVVWHGDRRLVAINTDGIARIDDQDRDRDRDRDRIDRDERERREDRERIEAGRLLVANTVIPVILNENLSSDRSRTGDTFTATVRTGDRDMYGPLPVGTRLHGRVASAVAQQGNEPGLLELRFDRIQLPDGRAHNINGSLFGLEDRYVERREDGTIAARPERRDDRLVMAGYGAGAGLLVGLATRRPLEGAILGGILGYIIGSVTPDRGRPTNVNLRSGTELGVRLENDVVIGVQNDR
jgi:hypothetical protein